MKVTYGDQKKPLPSFPERIIEIKCFIESKFLDYNQYPQNMQSQFSNNVSQSQASTKLKWQDVACYNEDSEGEKNYLSQDEDLEDASKYKKDKRLKQLACFVERRDGQQIFCKKRREGQQKESVMESCIGEMGVNSDG
jgi:hypothetical protein